MIRKFLHDKLIYTQGKLAARIVIKNIKQHNFNEANFLIDLLTEAPEKLHHKFIQGFMKTFNNFANQVLK